jgi:chromosomal replication initiator protein
MLRHPVDIEFVIHTAPEDRYPFGPEDHDDLPLLPSSPAEKSPAPRQASLFAEREVMAGAVPADEDWENNLNPQYTFDTFVVGDSNRMAQAAASAVSERPAVAYNPLFVCGGVGLGKTHLLHAIGNACAANGHRVLYVTSEQFTNHLVTSIRQKSTAEFRHLYRHVDVLLVDDVQFLAGKGSTQEEFFHTFNTLHSQGKQIILASDRRPQDMDDLEERLRSRFGSGLTVTIQPPQFETRVAILCDKSEIQGHYLPLNIAQLIAARIESNIRELEGTLNQVLAYTTLMGNRLTEDSVERVLSEKFGPRDRVAIQRQLSLADVLAAIVDYHQLSMDDLISPSRARDLVQARQLAIYIAREETDASLPEIGEAMGGRNHSTVIYSYNKFVEQMDRDPALRDKMEFIRQQLRTPSA